MNRQVRWFSTTLALLLCSTLVAPGALADPPRHAPAYGQRIPQPQPYYYAGYDQRRGSCNGDDVGTILGAVAGGVIGSKVAQGDDRVIGTVVGAVIGGVVGHQIGRSGDPDCGSQARGPISGYYSGSHYQPPRYYQNPPVTYVVPRQRPVYVVPSPRSVHIAPQRRQRDYQLASRHDARRHGNDCRRDDRGGSRDGRRSGCR